ncbi:LamG-like jellyroll fold domain-containing protein [Pontiella agarivorans]|uniref:FecR protein n=1 Tax=Pontiella agarivorans TaxID=3038953 RepID=A0ABU5MY60_9BACT|nr:LamG-like jellyroll fold domain-containing protein [Pontiella agarivorans]MDZ8119120.1 hypothetical protein [Pontiella agarivorans]
MNKQNEQLIAAYMAGEPVAEDLLEACRKDPQLLSRVTDLTIIDRLLAHCSEDDCSLFSAEVIQRLKIKDGELFAEKVRHQIAFRKVNYIKPLAWFAAAACLAISLLFIFKPNPQAFGHITMTTDAVWGTDQLSPGEKLPGDLLELTHGYSEVTMDNGVKLILEAPIEFEVRSSDLVVVHQGRLVARVPEQAIGFTVLTPNAEVIDLGTEFGISVTPSGGSEVHVLEGEVKARSLQRGPFANLVKNEAMVFNAHEQAKLITSNPQLFRRALPGRSANHPEYLHWSFNNTTHIAHCGGTGIAGQHYPGTLKSMTDNGSGPSVVEGVFDRALYFNGKDSYVTTDFPGIGDNHPRTVAFWSKIPADFSINEGYGMLGWGLMEPGSAWQISPNPDEKEGPLGCLRIGTMSAPVIGTTDLRDNQWHHIAIVMYGGDQADVSTHILLYVDGQLEMTARKSVAPISTRLDAPKSHALTFGRNIGYKKSPNRKLFRGALDEIYLFDTALDQEKIQCLMKTNRLN